ncbi:MAG TPA: AarF/ABC1/UbiB kinase family protein [Acidimicrobiales bacterium]|nr:AarF/ABC1/UbiB kinase family protein [Acidimicrobiales bacterium]
MRRLVLRAVVASAAAWGAYQLLRRTRRGAPDTGVSATTALARNVAVARTTARVGASYATHQARRVTASPERQAELDAAFEMKTAEEVVSVLGNMKGALMKIGQMASFLDDGLPEPMREALATLQADAPPMSASLAADVVEEELGARPEVLFAEWDEQPLSAASIGQVHKARTHDGRAVAVKVQYPGVAKAIRSDLDNSNLLFMVLGMVFPNLDPAPIVEEIRARLSEEVDYRLEARNQSDFHAWYADHPFIHVPAVVAEHSSGRVLTTELAEGVRFAEVAAHWSHEQKNLAAESIYRFVFRSLWRFHAFNGDPHPGNYLFRPDGRVTFLDFGLVKRFEPSQMHDAQRMIEAMVFDNDAAGYRRIVEELGMLQAGAPLTDAEVEEYFGYFYELIKTPGPQRITHEYAGGMVRQFFDVNASPVPKFANLQPEFVILQRINLGLMAILANLEADLDWRAIASELWPFTDGPPSSALGREEADWLARLGG